MRGDDHDRSVGILGHDPAEELQAFASVGRAALEIEIEQDCVWAPLFEQRHQFRRRAQRLHAFEQVAQREPRRERDIGIVIDDDGKVERSHATSVAPVSGNEQC